ncbi:MAG TPA: hypothetical protein VGM01_08270 [Ktedonobacteraceae bacterium]
MVFPLEHQAVAAPASWNIILSIDSIIVDQVAAPQLQPDRSHARARWLYHVALCWQSDYRLQQ